MLEQILFVATLSIAGYLLWKRASQIKASIQLGKKTKTEGNPVQRWKNVLLVAFGQKKMFQRFTPAFLHFWIYVGFIIINFEVLEFVIDGVVGTHRFFAPYLGAIYPTFITLFEFLATTVLTACIIFLMRRNILKIRRFWSSEMTAWPRLDANLILLIEIGLMTAILVMNATDQVLQTRGHYPLLAGSFFFSELLIPLFNATNTATLVYIERIAWWFHIVGIFGFAIYVTYSKHLHIFLAFPNTYYARLTPKGQIGVMPIVKREVESMLGMQSTKPAAQEDIGRLGAKDVNDLSRVHLLSAYACTECGRCTAECPANLTGKKLSPRKIMMDIRDRLTDVGNSLAKGGAGLNDGKTLLGDYTTKEEINACTSCNACVEACPILINPMEIILELRRYVVMEESGSPAQWNAMFQNIETNFAPWKFSPSDRFNWADELTINPKNNG